MEKSRLRLLVRGRVQGVCFRAFTHAVASNLGLSGLVWNRSDGNVELVAEGMKPDLLALLAQVRQGPPLAQVTSVDENWEPPKGDFRGFEISHRGLSY